MTRSPITRRELIRNGTLTLSLGAILAACGAGRSGTTAPGRLGVAPPKATLPDATLDDAVRLRTAQSLEHTLLDMYAALADTGAWSSGATAWLHRFVEDHTRHSAELAELITAAGGEAFACANPFIADRALKPALAALDGSDDPHRDVLNIATAFESLAGATYQALVGQLETPALRGAAMGIGGEEQRHAAALASLVTPEHMIDPTLTGGEEHADPNGFPVRFVIPARFGQLTGIELVVGAPDDEGARTAVTLETPSDNAFVYASQSC